MLRSFETQGVWMEQRQTWIAQARTLIDALDLVEPDLLPASFRDDVLKPVATGKEQLGELENSALFLALIQQLNELALQAHSRQWYFWEKVSQLLCTFCSAESMNAYRQGERNVLHKIHPLEPEEDVDEKLWPNPGVENLIEYKQEGHAQGFLVRLGPLTNNPLVLHFSRRGIAPRLARPKLEQMVASGNLIFSLVKSHFPMLDITRGMLLVDGEPEADDKVNILGKDPVFLQSLESVKQASKSEAPVYLRGESGTGKELFARYLHEHSNISDGPFVPINCSAIPSELIESELFGHEKGAFTGAYYRKIGKAEQANGGTLFLDEIGEMPLAFQAKLLRFLQEKRFTRVGGNQQVVSDARIVVATHRDLKEMVAKGTFREDLYYRVHVIPITIAPLRERGGDIRFLAENFFARYIGKSRMSRRRVDEAIFDVLENYHFPGNVRELDNIIQRTVVMTQKPVIALEDLPDEVKVAGTHTMDFKLHPFERFDNIVPKDRDTLRWLKKEVESVTFSYQRDLDRRFLLNLLKQHDGSARKAAEGANINRTLFYKLLKRAGLDIGTMQKG